MKNHKYTCALHLDFQLKNVNLKDLQCSLPSLQSNTKYLNNQPHKTYHLKIQLVCHHDLIFYLTQNHTETRYTRLL